jgi:hypothetical protein
MECGGVYGLVYGLDGGVVGGRRVLVGGGGGGRGECVLDFDVESYGMGGDRFLVCWTEYDQGRPGHAGVRCGTFRSGEEETVSIDRAEITMYHYKFYRENGDKNYFLPFKFFRLLKIEVGLFSLSVGFRQGSGVYGVSDGPLEFTTRMLYFDRLGLYHEPATKAFAPAKIDFPEILAESPDMDLKKISDNTLLMVYTGSTEKTTDVYAKLIKIDVMEHVVSETWNSGKLIFDDGETCRQPTISPQNSKFVYMISAICGTKLVVR